jgi:Zn-dependent M28 family amino/carboxypeptidase
VLETGCATNDPSSAIVLEPPKQVFAEGLKGTLTLYGSKKCPRITWAHFRPLADNASDFLVTITMGGRPYIEQKSVPGNKLVEAYTVGAKGKIGDKAVGCVTPAGKPAAKVCLETEIV